MPTIFHISLRRELEQLSGDTGGRQLAERYWDRVLTVPGCPGDMLSLDIDTEEDYRRLLAYWQDGAKRE